MGKGQPTVQLRHPKWATKLLEMGFLEEKVDAAILKCATLRRAIDWICSQDDSDENVTSSARSDAPSGAALAEQVTPRAKRPKNDPGQTKPLVEKLVQSVSPFQALQNKRLQSVSKSSVQSLTSSSQRLKCGDNPALAYRNRTSLGSLLEIPPEKWTTKHCRAAALTLLSFGNKDAEVTMDRKASMNLTTSSSSKDRLMSKQIYAEGAAVTTGRHLNETAEKFEVARVSLPRQSCESTDAQSSNTSTSLVPERRRRLSGKGPPFRTSAQGLGVAFSAKLRLRFKQPALVLCNCCSRYRCSLVSMSAASAKGAARRDSTLNKKDERRAKMAQLLQDMGFTQEQVQASLAECTTLRRAIEWLCATPEERAQAAAASADATPVPDIELGEASTTSMGMLVAERPRTVAEPNSDAQTGNLKVPCASHVYRGFCDTLQGAA